MGNASSQLASTQTEDASQKVPGSQESPSQAKSVAMEDAAQRDEPRVKKRRNVSGDAIRPTKKSRKDREHEQNVDGATGLEHDDELVQATGEVTRKRSKKKSKREGSQRNNDEDTLNEIPATQDSFLSQGLPQSTADTTNEGSASKPAKSKRKRPTGRPSGLNLVPAGISEPPTQEDITQEKSASLAIGRSFTAVNSQAQPHAADQTPSKKPQSSKHAKRSSAQVSPELTKTQDSQPALNKRPKSKKRQNHAEQDEESGSLHVPPNETEDASRNVDVVPTPPDTLPEAYGELRDDYSEVDATGQVKGWLSEQRTNGTVPETPKVNSHGNALRKKAAVNSSARRKEGEKATKNKHKRVSQHHDDDSEDYQPNGRDDDGEAPNSRGASKRKSMSSQNEAVEEVEETPAKNLSSSRASEKQKASSKNNEDANDEITPKQQKRTKQKNASRKNNMRANSPIDDGESEAEQPESPPQINQEDEGVNDSSSTRKKRSKKEKEHPAKHKKRGSNENGAGKDSAQPSNRPTAKGLFTTEEKEKVDSIFQQSLAESGMSDPEFRTVLQNWRGAGDFKRAVEEALPDRSVAAIRKFCQRRYHNLERGPWTQEQDESLKNAYTANPDKWTEISALVGRTAADCKDRWKNSVSIEETIQLGPWSRDDEAKLVKAVGDCVKEMKKANKGDKNFPTDRAELEGMISWREVANRLDGTRSAKRCHEKWQKLKKREERGRPKTPAKPLPTGLGPDQSSKKLKVAERLYNQCDVGDLFDILTEIHTAIPNHALQYDHETTVWSTVSLKNKNSRFRSAMRRRGLHDAAEVYGQDIGPQPTIAATAKALADYLEGQWGIEALREKRSYEGSPRSSRKIKSSERVESDGESPDDEAQRGAITKEVESDEEPSDVEVAESDSE